MLVNYFQELFSSARQNSTSSVLDQVQLVITSEMNIQLSSRFMASEVVVALKEMAPLKAPDPDGMPPLFYQHFWPLFYGDITRVVLSWLNSSTLPSPVNNTLITLIPKSKSLVCVTEFRPISLCNVLYKIF